MTRLRRGVRLAVGVWALVSAGTALAQEDLDRGKSGAQLYAADCAICHKSVQRLELGNAGGIFGLDSFLREHYTASRESAKAIAAYLRGVQQVTSATPARRRARKQTARGEDRGRPNASKPAEGKSAEKKPKATVGPKPDKSE